MKKIDSDNHGISDIKNEGVSIRDASIVRPIENIIKPQQVAEPERVAVHIARSKDDTNIAVSAFPTTIVLFSAGSLLVCFGLIFGILCRSKIKSWLCGTNYHNHIEVDRKQDYEIRNSIEDRTVAEVPLKKLNESSD